MESITAMLSDSHPKKLAIRQAMSNLEQLSSSLFSFSLQCKDLDDHFDATRYALERRMQEVRTMEDLVRVNLDEFERKRRKMDELEESLRGLMKNIRKMESEFSERVRVLMEVKRREIEEKVEVLESMKREIEERLVEVEGTERCVECLVGERVRDLESREKELEEKLKALRSKEKEIVQLEERPRVVEENEEKVGERLREVERREKECETRCKEQLKMLESKQKEFEERMVRIRLEEAGLRELLKETALNKKEFESQIENDKLEEKMLKDWSEEIELEKREMEKRAEEFALKEKRFEELFVSRIKNVELEEKRLKDWGEEIKLENRDVEKQVQEFVLKEKRFEELFVSRIKNVELEEKRLKDWSEEIELEKRDVEKRMQEFVLKEKRFEELSGQFELEKKEFEERFKDGIVKEARLLETYKEIERKEKQCDKRYKEIELAKERLDIALLATLRADRPINVGVKDALGMNTPDCVVMDGKALQVFLDEHSKKEHKVMREVVLSLLRLCSEPAKLVLDAMEGFYPQHGNLGLELETVRMSCVLLLEILRKISPNISSHLKGEAMKLSFHWISKMRVDSHHSIEVAGFLLLIAAYGLANAFDVEELVNYAESVAHWRGIPNVCRTLGLMAKIPGLIRNLLKKKQHLVAIGYILEFNLIDEFPPCSVLDDYTKISENAANEIIRNGNNSFEAQIQATNKRIAALKNVIRCIEYHNIQSGCCPENIKQVIESLKKQNALQKKDAVPVGSKVQMQKSAVTCHGHADSDIALASALVLPSIDATHTDDEATGSATTGSPMQQDSNNSHPQAAGSSEVPLEAADCGANSAVHSLEVHCQESMDLDNHDGSSIGSPSCKCYDLSVEGKGKLLRKLLCQDGANESVLGEISCMLKSSADPAYLVLDAMKNSSSSNLKRDEGFEVGIPIKSCILLLEYLKRILPLIEPQLLEEAGLYAKMWEAKLKLQRDDYMEVVCFLQFITVYNLCSTFDAEEICGLLDPLYWCQQVPDTCRLLGIGDIFPDHYMQKLIEDKHWLQAVKYIHMFKLEDKFPLVPLLKYYMMDAQNKADELCKEENNSPAVQVRAIRDKIEAAKVIIECIDRYNLDSQYPRESLEDAICQLKKQEMERKRELDDNSKVGLVTKSMQTSENQDGEEKKCVQSASSLASSSVASSIIRASNPACTSRPGNASVSQPEVNNSCKRPRTASTIENLPNVCTGPTVGFRPVQQPHANWHSGRFNGYPLRPHQGMPPSPKQPGWTNLPGMRPLYPGNFNYIPRVPMPFVGQPNWRDVARPLHGHPTQMRHW